MIVVDTNVVSELMKAAPDQTVRAWSARHSVATLYTTSITEAEILYGIELLPEGRRREAIRAAAQAIFTQSFGGRVLAFGSNAASAYASIMSRRRRLGRPMNHAGGQIAAIALAAGAALATRNVADFEGSGLKLTDPWKR